MTSALVGAILGALIAGGVALLRMNAKRSARIESRVLPYVQATGFDWSSSTSVTTTGQSTKYALAALNSLVADSSVQRRLTQANATENLEQFRIDQLRWTGLGAAATVAFGILKAISGEPIAPLPWLMLCGVAAVGGALLRDHRLSQHARRRIEAMSNELPTFAELLAFTVAAGLAPASALNRIAERVGGEFAIELRKCCDEVATGRPFTEALEAMALRTGSAPVERFVDGIIVAIERGTPIAEVLRAQAMDARSASHRSLMESAGKREIFALIPVVFLILPAVVVIAVFPGILGLVISTP